MQKTKEKARESENSTHKVGIPYWYNCEVDFAAARRADKPVQLIKVSENNSLQVLNAVDGKPLEEVADAMKPFKNWGYTYEQTLNDYLEDSRNSAGHIEHNCIVIKEVRNTSGLFSLVLFYGNRDFYFFTAVTENYFKLDYNKCGSASYEVIDYNTENPTMLMKVDENYKNFSNFAPMLDPKNDSMFIDWTYNQKHQG